MFQSLYTITFSVVGLSLLIPAIVLWKSPYSIVNNTLANLQKNRGMILQLFVLFLILYFNKMELKYGEATVTEDYTHIIHNWEGNLVYYLQQIFLNDHLTLILTFFYIIVFPALMIASMLLYLNIEDYKSFYSFVYALMLNYGLAIPFFLFLPIYEVWYYDSNIQFLIPQVYPSFESEYRQLSGINNNFPSLHTAISLSMAIVAYNSKSIRFSNLVIFSVSFIIFSTLFLGIHWLSDLAAGGLLAIIATQTSFRLSELTERVRA